MARRCGRGFWSYLSAVMDSIMEEYACIFSLVASGLPIVYLPISSSHSIDFGNPSALSINSFITLSLISLG
jgi:hypothetical protein